MEEPCERISHRYRLWEQQGGRCYYCGEPVDEEEATVDHMIPTSFGGEDRLENKVMSCRHCNNRKSNSTPRGFACTIKSVICESFDRIDNLLKRYVPDQPYWRELREILKGHRREVMLNFRTRWEKKHEEQNSSSLSSSTGTSADELTKLTPKKRLRGNDKCMISSQWNRIATKKAIYYLCYPLQIDIYHEDEKWTLTCTSLRITETSDDSQKTIELFCDHFEALIDTIANEEDSNLTPDAICLKHRLLGLIESIEHLDI